MYPRNAASPPRLCVGSIYLIADGTIQTSGASVRVRPEGGVDAAGGGTLAYDTTSGAIFYTPTQAETNYTAFCVTVYKASCTSASITVVTTADSTAGKVLLGNGVHGGAAASFSFGAGGTISNGSGSALVLTSSGGNGHGLQTVGNGSGDGINITGGATGWGIDITYGFRSVNSAGSAMLLNSSGANGHGLQAIGNGTGEGINLVGGASGNGLYIADGVYVINDGGNAISFVSSGGNGAGVYVAGNGTGDGVYVVAGATGNALELNAVGGNDVHLTTDGGEIVAAVRDAILDRLLAGNHDTAGTPGKLLQQIFTDTNAEGVVVAAASKTGYSLAASEDVYHAHVYLTVDDANSQDEYTAVWFKNGVRVTSGITSPTIQVVKRSDGTDLVASTAMSQIGSTGSYKKDEATNRLTAGEAAVAIVAATIDAGSRSFAVVVGRDSSA